MRGRRTQARAKPEPKEENPEFIAPGSRLTRKEVYDAAKNGNLDIINEALKYNVHRSDKGRLLFWAAKNGHLAVTDRLLHEKDISNTNNELVAGTAAGEGHRDIVDLILTSMDPKNIQGAYNSIIYNAAVFGRNDIVDEFMNDNIQFEYKGDSLKAAVEGNYTHIIDTILYHTPDEELQKLLNYPRLTSRDIINRIREEQRLRKQPEEYAGKKAEVHAELYKPGGVGELKTINEFDLAAGRLSPQCNAMTYPVLRRKAVDSLSNSTVIKLCEAVSLFQDKIELEGTCRDLEMADLVAALKQLIGTLPKRDLCSLIEVLSS